MTSTTQLITTSPLKAECADGSTQNSGTRSLIEIWKPVVGWEGWYEVSNIGRVRRLSRACAYVRRKHPRRNYAPKIIGGCISPSVGYRYVSLSRKGERARQHSIHALVLEAFVGPRPTGAYGCHNDGDRLNNRLDNLRWGTPKENQEDRVRHGRHQLGEANGSSKLKDSDRLEILRLRGLGMPYYKIAPMFKVCTQTAWDVCNKQVWLQQKTGAEQNSVPKTSLADPQTIFHFSLNGIAPTTIKGTTPLTSR